VIATPYASGFDHFYIADDVQFKFDRCLRNLTEPVSSTLQLLTMVLVHHTKYANFQVNDLPTFGVGHSLGSLIHLLIGKIFVRIELQLFF
jgi:hypothetical protein